MDAPITKDEVTLLLPTTPSRTALDVEAIRLAAVRARDKAIAAWLRRTASRIVTAVAVVAEAVMAWPRRRQVIAELQTLTDRELADIGMTRGDIGRVFESGFRATLRPANDTALKTPARKAA